MTVMAPFLSDLRHPLEHWWLPQTALHFSSVKIPRLPTNMPRTSEKHPPSSCRALTDLPMLQKMSFCLCEVLRRVIHCFLSVAKCLNMNIFILCAGETMAMISDSMKSAMEVQERLRPVWNSQLKVSTPVKTLSTQVKVMMSVTDMTVPKPDQLLVGGEIVLSDWLEWETTEEQEESDDASIYEDKNEDQEEGEDTDWSEDDSSVWSDDEDSEAFPESTALWESFFNNSDPYNPFCLSCPTGVKAKASDTRQPPSSPTADTETPVSADPHSPEQRTKKVKFSEEVRVHHLMSWSAASQAARDGSCWMEQARDRERFKRRVEKAGDVISPCLSVQHRARVWDRLERES